MTRHYSLFLMTMAAGVAALGQTVPDAIRVPAGHTAFLKASAVGTQNYVCLPAAGGGLAWKFQGPQATLFITFRWFTGVDIRHQVATHFLSPNPEESGTPARATWQSSSDTSAVWAKKIAESSDPAFVAAGAIPWFLLQIAGHQNGPAGGAMFGAATYIQRVNTTGGMMPTPEACAEAGAIRFVSYTADYVFFRAAESGR